MKIDYRWPDEIDPSEVEGIAEAVDHAARCYAKRGSLFTAGDLMSAAKLLRILAEACEGKGTLTTMGESDGSL